MNDWRPRSTRPNLWLMSRSEIDALYGRLLEHHKLLLAATREEYEREHGPVENATAFLQLLIQGEAFAWLQPFTAALVEIDDPQVTPEVATAREKLERLFSAETPKFHTRHLEVLANRPEAAQSHEETLKMLGALPRATRQE